MNDALQGRRVLIGDRPLFQGTGVATYGAALRKALELADLAPLALYDSAMSGAGPPRWRRWLRAVAGASLPLIDDADGTLRGHDLFREAQVTLDVRGHALRVICPGPPGIVHWTYPMPIYIQGWINVHTIHDTIPLTAPDLTPIDPSRFRRMIEAVLKVTDLIVTVSACSRDDIMRSFELGSIEVVDCGLAPASDPPARSIGAAPPFLLACGSIEPRKNLVRLVDAYIRSGVDLPLRIAGPRGWHADIVLAEIGQAAGVEWLGYQDRAALAGLVADARALLMPSLAEGFGLPVLEAMRAGTPVVTSDRGALAEVAYGAALGVDPTDVTALAMAIRRVCEDTALAARLGDTGRQRAELYTSRRFAERLIAAYRGCIAFGQGSEYPPARGTGAGDCVSA